MSGPASPRAGVSPTDGPPAGITVKDAALVAGLLVFDLAAFWDRRVLETSSIPPAVVVIYGAAGYTALLWRRRAPLTVFAVMWLYSMVALLLPGYHPTLGLLVALYTVAAYRPGPTALPALAAVFIPNGFTVAEEARTAPSGRHDEVLVISAALYVAITLIVWGTGRWVGASRRRVIDLEHRRRLAAREAVVGERRRIARELHDIVAHSVTVMVLQAGGARRVLTADPAQADEALAHVGNLGKEAMSELRRMLVVLRDDDPDNERDTVGHQPGLADLQDLIEDVGRAGIAVHLDVAGAPGRVDPSVELAAFRVVQEALTNATKHAGSGAHADVRIRWADDLLVQVTDDGTGQTRDDAGQLSTGHGLLGLRERVAIANGQLAVGLTPAGGFQVTARLPLAEATAAELS